ncbi:MAG: 30S ribosomal protein S2 [Anaerolineales bacterium]|nr:30S ribosomal protein S2 [Anaerolineales bacterium]
MANGSSNTASVVPMKSLLEAGVHFGHRTRRWNPKMKPYIFTERNGIHIIDLQQTITRLNQAYAAVRDTVAAGGAVLFVGTKRQSQETIVQEASRAGMPFVEQRWLGGTLTNWRTIRQRIDYLLDIEKQQARGEFARLPKKEALLREQEIARLNHRLGGLKDMRRLPNLLFVTDVRRDALAIKEANTLGIPVIAMVDTNCDPEPIDYVIPSNDDAIRAIKLMVNTIANAAFEGRAMLSTIQAEEEEAAGVEGEEALERYLGPSTLAKIRAEATLDDESEEEYEDEGDYENEEAAEVEVEEESAEIEAAPPAPLIPSPIAAALAATASEEAEENVTEEDVVEENVADAE